MKNFDYYVIGAGLAGGVIARCLADRGKSICMVERRNHIAGNLYDFEMNGIKVQKYGPHVFHTNEKKVYDFLIKYCTPIKYKTKCEAVIDGVSTPSPFNFKTIDQFYSESDSEKLKDKLLNYYGNRPFVTVVEMLECEEDDIRGYAKFLFEKDYRPYTAKQWELDPNEIDPSVLKRVPILLSYRDTYFDDEYEFIPAEGFSGFYSRLIDSPQITCITDVEAKDYISFKRDRIIYNNDEDTNVIYTGAIDELFEYRYGALPYRSLRFDYQTYDTSSFQNAAIVAYPQEHGFTRITEYTKMPHQNCDRTVVAVEYPEHYERKTEFGNEPYYPVLTEDSKTIYKKYQEYALRYKNLTLCGRLADFKYYNMDQVVLRAMEIFEEMERRGL